MENVILRGNCLETLKQIPDGTVDCCVTSPPYYGLRDYGTGKWVGGDPNCDHKIEHTRKDSVCGVGTHSRMENDGIPVGGTIVKSKCPKCGAIREDSQIGLEITPEDYIENLVKVFREVKRTLKDDGTLWVNIGDTYYGHGGRGADYHDSRDDVIQSSNKGFSDMQYVPIMKGHSNLKEKDLIGIPWMLAFALRNDGWYLRQDIIWHKPSPMPESVKDRCTKSHEYIFLLSKNSKYYFDHDTMQEVANEENKKRYDYDFNTGKEQEDFRPDGASNTPGKKEYTGMRNKRDVWTVNSSSFKGAHFATFPEELIEPMILAGSRKDGIVLDPFMGSGTVGVVAKRNGRKYLGCELNPEYADMAQTRIDNIITSLF